MKLDFSGLAQPAAKARGQVGTTGTQAFTRVSASPLTQPGAGTAGDKPAAVGMAPDPVVAMPAACPPVSPACPRAPDAERLNAGAVSPVSPLVPTEAAQAAEAAPVECGDLVGEPIGSGAKTCGDCQHLLRHGTCGEPVGAGLVSSFGIVWPPDGHAAGCAAFSSKTPAASQDRPHRLTNDQGDRCHVPCWNDAEIDLFQARHARFVRLGLIGQDAEDLAERLTLRDRDRDDRRMSLECRELALSGHCNAAARGAMPGVDRQMEVVPDILMRCQSFMPALSAYRINQGTEDANHDD